MLDVKLTPRQVPSMPLDLDPAALGVACCIAAAVGYTAVNACLRYLAVHCDQVWVVAVKELVAVVVLGPWLVYLARRRGGVLPSGRVLAGLVLVGLLTQLVGNLPSIWAMSVVGLAVALPVILGFNIVVGALLGRVFLGERVSSRSAIAIGLLIASVVLLSMGAGRSNASIAASAEVATGTVWVLLGVGACCATGTIYAVLVVVIRRSVTNGVSPAAVAAIITGTGVVSLVPIALWHHGISGLASAPTRHLALMLATGVLNLLAFLAITKGLQLTTIVRANVLGASQVAMGAVVGITVFGEPPGRWLVLGVCLTVLGMVLLKRPA